MKATIGRIVITKEASDLGEAVPAIVTKVWNGQDTRNGPGMVNLTTFPDRGGHGTHVTSVNLYDSEEEAMRPESQRPNCWWPERV